MHSLPVRLLPEFVDNLVGLLDVQFTCNFLLLEEQHCVLSLLLEVGFLERSLSMKMSDETPCPKKERKLWN